MSAREANLQQLIDLTAGAEARHEVDAGDHHELMHSSPRRER